MIVLKNVILGTGRYCDVKSGNTLSISGDGGSLAEYSGPSYKKLAPKLATYTTYSEKLNELNNLKKDVLRIKEYLEYKRQIEYEYIKSYYDIRLKGMDIGELLYILKEKFGEDIILLCYEDSSSFCHRRLIADYIEIETGIYIPEVSVDEKGNVKKLIPNSYKDRLIEVMKR